MQTERRQARFLSAALDHMERPAHDRNVVGIPSGFPLVQSPRITRVSARGARAAYERSRSMTKNITWVGLDAHKKAINVAMLVGHDTKAQEWVVENKPAAVRRLVKKLVREADAGEVRCCYEAGPCGYALQRQMEAAGPVICEVIAPALIPRKPGERIKTDRRDARKLGELLRAGLLTEVQAPTPEQEAVRDLCRAREDAKEDLLRCRHRRGKMLLRRDLVYSGGKKAWTPAHRTWLRSVQCDHTADQAVLSDYLLAIEQVEQRLQTLDQQLRAAAESDPLRERVGWLRCFRGIDTVTAVTVVAELHGLERFTSPRALMAYVGLVPSEHSSSDRMRGGCSSKPRGTIGIRRTSAPGSKSAARGNRLP